MKKKLLVAFSVLAVSLISTIDLHAQGTIWFANIGGPYVVTNNPAGGFGRAVGSTYQVALYWGPLGADEADLVQISSAVHGFIINGYFNGGNCTTPDDTAPGEAAMFQVRGWTGSYSSFEDAVASGDPTVLVGVSDMWQNYTGGNGMPPVPPAPFTFGPGGFNGLLLDTP
jgi:hypothetical protein